MINETETLEGTICTFEETIPNEEGKSPRFLTCYKHLLIKHRLYFL